MKTGKKPLTCDGARALMFDYIDGTATEAEKAALSEHIASCDDCKSELSKRENMLGLVKLTSKEPPKALKDEVMAKIEFIPREKKKFTPSVKLASALAACACVVAVVALSFRGILFDGLSNFDAPNAAEDVADGNHSKNYYSYYSTAAPQWDATAADDVDVFYGAPDAELESSLLDAVTAASSQTSGSLTVEANRAERVTFSGGTSSGEINRVYETALADLADGAALAVGYFDELAYAMPESEADVCEFDGIECRYYVISERSLEAAWSIVKNEDSAGGAWRVYMPAEGEISELRLIIIEK